MEDHVKTAEKIGPRIQRQTKNVIALEIKPPKRVKEIEEGPMVTKIKKNAEDKMVLIASTTESIHESAERLIVAISKVQP